MWKGLKSMLDGGYPHDPSRIDKIRIAYELYCCKTICIDRYLPSLRDFGQDDTVRLKKEFEKTLDAKILTKSEELGLEIGDLKAGQAAVMSSLMAAAKSQVYPMEIAEVALACGFVELLETDLLLVAETMGS